VQYVSNLAQAAVHGRVDEGKPSTIEGSQNRVVAHLLQLSLQPKCVESLLSVQLDASRDCKVELTFMVSAMAASST